MLKTDTFSNRKQLWFILFFLSVIFRATLQQSDADTNEDQIMSSQAIIYRDQSFLVRSMNYHRAPGILSNVQMSQTENNTGQQLNRDRRSLFKQEEQQACVDKHNALRRQEGASNMNLLVWSNALAACAEAWAKECNFIHGQPPSCLAGLEYRGLGQNLYATTGNKPDCSAATQNWYNEKGDYTFDTLGCRPGKACGHYTQVVWAESQEVGCAYAFCSVLSSTPFSNAYYTVCNYGPAGNVEGHKPYQKGDACSKCSTGCGWCDNGLCNKDCRGPSPTCACQLKCKNCGTLDEGTCKCKCADGWHGPDCSVRCENTNPKCNASPGWPPTWCNTSDFKDTVLQNCPVMCKLCVPSNNPRTCRATRKYPDLHWVLLLSCFNLLIALFIAECGPIGLPISSIDQLHIYSRLN